MESAKPLPEDLIKLTKELNPTLVPNYKPTSKLNQLPSELMLLTGLSINPVSSVTAKLNLTTEFWLLDMILT